MNKKIILLLIAFFFSPVSTVLAGGYSENWSYSFHLEEQNGILMASKDADGEYIPIPELYVPKISASTADYYGVIFNLKAIETARFGFNKPETVLEALGKSVFDIKAPFSADADHVNFYTKNKKLLFTISVKGSSFCNDNKICNADIGEDYTNCPYDCPPPPVVPVISTPVPPESTTTVESQPIQTPAIEATTTEAPTITTQTPSTPLTKTNITLIVLGLVFLILIFILWKLRSFSEG